MVGAMLAPESIRRVRSQVVNNALTGHVLLVEAKNGKRPVRPWAPRRRAPSGSCPRAPDTAAGENFAGASVDHQ
jgi:hypothetical protein